MVYSLSVSSVRHLINVSIMFSHVLVMKNPCMQLLPKQCGIYLRLQPQLTRDCLNAASYAMLMVRKFTHRSKMVSSSTRKYAIGLIGELFAYINLQLALSLCRTRVRLPHHGCDVETMVDVQTAEVKTACDI